MASTNNNLYAKIEVPEEACEGDNIKFTFETVNLSVRVPNNAPPKTILNVRIDITNYLSILNLATKDDNAQSIIKNGNSKEILKYGNLLIEESKEGFEKSLNEDDYISKNVVLLGIEQDKIAYGLKLINKTNNVHFSDGSFLMYSDKDSTKDVAVCYDFGTTKITTYQPEIILAPVVQ